MRKVLLTTTALVALGGISAASALDISGFQRFQYSSWDDTASDEDSGRNDTKFSDYNRVEFKHSRTGDNGLTASGYYRINNWSEAYQDISLSGDFGKVSMGNYHTAGGFMYNGHIYNGTFIDNVDQTFSGVSTSAAAAISDGSTSDFSVNYTLPSIGGLDAMITQTDAGTAVSEGNDVTEIGVSYAGVAGAMNYRVHVINAAMDDTTGQAADQQDNQEMGINIDSGPYGFRYTNVSKETSDTLGVASVDIDTNEYGVTYKVDSDLTVGVIKLSSKDKLDATNAPNLDETIFAANYFIMPGLRVQASYVDFDYSGATSTDNNAGTQTNVALRLDF
jgi:hypothetical protein